MNDDTREASTVMVAMSGGVDSSLAAALLKEAGYKPVGVNMRLWSDGSEDVDAYSSAGRCCTLELMEGARRVADQLGIPFYALSFEREFGSWVVDYFVREYAEGRTPNPCLACNRFLKFSFLLDRALALGVNLLATGHYARVRRDGDGWKLLKAVDASKDQSYALYMLGQRQLSKLLFPLGDYLKSETRRMARERGLYTATQPESQEICFIPNNDYRGFLTERLQEAIKPGPILDLEGREIGRHEGLPFYTVGQRKGLGIQRAEPLYVIRMDPAANALIVGPSEALWRREFTVCDVSFVSDRWPQEPFQAGVKVRYRAPEVGGVVRPLPDRRVRVELIEPQRAVTPGQSAVFYDGEIVLGGGVIEE